MSATLALCIPAYNAAWCLPRLLESAKNQEIPFDEIWVYNDCSTDNTEEIALQYGVKVLNGTTNKGCSYGKNELAKVVQSDWIHFHDADDLLLPNFTKVAHKYITDSFCADIILCNFNYIDEKTNKILAIANYNRKSLKKDNKKFVLENKLVNFAIINKNKFNSIKGFNLDQNVLYNEDRAFYAKAIVNNLSFDYDDEVTCINYKQVSSMSSSNISKCTWAHFHVSKYLIDNLPRYYAQNIGLNIWQNTTIAASLQDWELVKLSLNEIKDLNFKIPNTENLIIRAIAKINPFVAFYIREKLIRVFKPTLRVTSIYL